MRLILVALLLAMLFDNINRVPDIKEIEACRIAHIFKRFAIAHIAPSASDRLARHEVPKL